MRPGHHPADAPAVALGAAEVERPGAVVSAAWRRSALERPSVVHGRLKILWVAQLHVHPNVIREATDEELGVLARRQVLGVACHRLEPVSEVLDRRGER